MKTMHASVTIPLPADEFDEATAKLQLKPLWDEFLAAMLAGGLDHTAKLETLETRAKPAATGAKRGRKAKLTVAQITPLGGSQE